MLRIVILLSTLGLQADIWMEKLRSFDKGKVYQFYYSSQALSGLPKSSAEYNGLQINSLIEFKFESKSNVLMTLKTVEILETINSVRTRNPFNYVNKKDLKKLNIRNSGSFLNLFSPVRFKWKIENKITDFKTLASDDAFSVNIKRGILNMLNVELKLNQDNWEDEGGSYIVHEDEGIDGTCSATYLWSLSPYKTPTLLDAHYKIVCITRTKSSNKCQKPIGEDTANFVEFTSPKKEIDQNRNIVKNINEVLLNMTIWNSKMFFVWEGIAKSSYSIEPKNVEKETMSTFVIQSLKFLKVNEMPSENSDEPTTPKSLMMDLSPVDAKLTNIDKIKIVALIEKLVELTGNVIPELIRLLRLANEQDMAEINKKVLAIVKTKPDILKPYLDVLAEVLNEVSTKSLILDFVLKPMPHINDDNDMAMRIIPLAGINYVRPMGLITLLTTAAESQVLQQHKHRYNTLKATLLTIGSLAGSYHSNNPSSDILSNIKFLTEIVPTLNTSLGKEEMKIVIIKALGNMGTEKSFPDLQNYINDKTKSLPLRVQAVYSLRKLPRQSPTIELLLLTIFNDITEDVELRLAAGVDICLRHTRPSTLNSLIGRLRREPILQVKSFMQDLIVELSKLPNLKDIFEPLLRKLSVKKYPSEYSRVFTIPVDSGVASVSLIYTPESQMPRTGNIIFYDFRFGKTIIPFEIGFRFQNSKSNQEKNFMKFISDIVRTPASKISPDSETMTIFLKRYNNEVSFWSVNKEFSKFFNVEKLEDIVKFLKGEKSIDVKKYLNTIMYGKTQLPTTMGLTYSAELNGVMDLRLDMVFSTIFQPKTKSSKFNMDIKPYWKTEILFDTGIDAGYIKSQLNTKLSLVSPKTDWFNVSINARTTSFSIGMKKPKNDIHILQHSLEKKFKMTYYNKTNDLWGSSKFVDITPFYVPKSKLKILKTLLVPFPFGMLLNKTYFCDAGKPRLDGNKMSLFSAGDAFKSLSLKKNQKSDFDEFQFEINEDVFHETKKYIFSVNHIKNKRVIFKLDLITMKVVFGIGNRIDILWPENIKSFMDAIGIVSSKSKKPELKYVRLSGSIKFPKPIQFNSNIPLKIWTHLEQYSYTFTGTINNSKNNTLHNFQIQLKTEEQAKNLAEDIAQKPTDYAAHDDVLAQCTEDIEQEIPNSPSCFSAWSKLNYFNQISVSLNWTSEGFARFKGFFNRMNIRATMSKFLLSEKFSNNSNDYQFQYSLLPYYYPSSIASTTLQSLTIIYKSVHRSRLNLMQNLFKDISISSIYKEQYKTCQIRKGKGNVMSIKSFDNYLYNVKWNTSSSAQPNVIRYVFVQEETNLFQISSIGTAKEYSVQIIGKYMPVLRVTRDKTKNKVEFFVDGKSFTQNTVKWNHLTVAHMNRLPNSIYGNTTVYEIVLPVLNIRILSDLVEIADIEVSKNYYASLRGMCGDMNGEFYNDFKNANCTGSYALPETMFVNSDYKNTFETLTNNGALTEFIPLKGCSMYQTLSLLETK